MYSSPEFVQLTNGCRELVESAAAGLPASELKRIEDAFLISSRYEYLFWEAAWQQEQWTV